MRAGEGDLKQLGPWRSGANNLAAESSVPSSSFRDGVNVVVADDGKVSRREGFSKIFDIEDAHSLFGYGRRGFFAAGTTLYATELYDDGSLAEPVALYEGLVVDAPLAHCLIEPTIYVSDGGVTLRVSPSNEVAPWALPFAPLPIVSSTLPDGGSLPAGRYQFAIAYRAANGEEGPLSNRLILDITGAEQPVVAFQAAPVGVERQLLFLTKPNGSELLLYGSVPAASTSATLTTIARLGRPPAAADLDPMPAGRFAAYFAGRLLVSAEDFLWWSEPGRYSLTQLAYNYIPVSEPITGIGVVGETTGGFFLGQQTRVYFVRGGDPSDATLSEVYPAGMVPGSLTHVPGARLPMEAPPTVPVPVWLATNGVICAGMQDGSVLPLTEARFAADVGVEGAGVFIQQAGVNRLVVTTREPSDNVFAVSDSVSIEVVRNGISP